MELQDVILERRSIRKYKNDIIDIDIIKNAIKYGTLAPSAHNRQPWKFKIIFRDDIDFLADKLESKTAMIEGHSGGHTALVMRNLPVMIVVFLDSELKGIDRDMDVISIGACIENIILYLTDLGLGTLWIGNTNLINKDIKEYFDVNLDTISCIGVGVKGQEPHLRPRKDFNDVII